MAKPNDSGDKNEKPTPKKLKDARKDGNIAKSRDLSQTAMTLTWLLLLLALGSTFADRLGSLFDQTWLAIGDLSPQSRNEVAAFALETALWLVLMPLCAASVIGVLIEFLQVGPLLAFKKIAPKGSHIHPVEGFKRMFSKDNLFEVGKSLVKSTLVVVLVMIIAKHYIDDALLLPLLDPVKTIELNNQIMMQLCFWIIGTFGFLSIVDVLYQKHAHQKRLMMSMYDIRQEHKQSEGDPHLKGKRKQLHKEWSMQDIMEASRNATALVVNPTHIAVALSYIPDTFALPTISAKAEGSDALRMREAALAAGVPVMRHIPLARELNFRGEYEDVVPEDLFDVIAQVLIWAERTKEQACDSEDYPLYQEYDPTTGTIHAPGVIPA